MVRSTIFGWNLPVGRARLPAMELAEVLDNHRIIVCVGSGGVGKTTTSAAFALRAAMSGKRALCMTIDPARRLANSLGLSELSREEQRIAPELFTQSGLECPGTLSAMMLDMKHTFDELVTRHASSDEQRDRILQNRIYQYVSSSLSGTQEYMAMERLHQVQRSPDYDFIVLDTPPTSNALDFLDAPQKLIGAIDSPVMRWFVQAMDKGRGMNLLGKGAGFMLKGLARFTGVEFLDNVGEFVRELNALFGGFRQRAEAVYEDLRSDEVAFVIVTSPEPAAVAEAVYFGRMLADYDITPKAVVVNRVHSPPSITADTPDVRALLAKLDPDMPGVAKRLQQVIAEDIAVAERDQEGVKRLQEHLKGSLGYTSVPAMETDVHNLAALAQVGQHY